MARGLMTMSVVCSLPAVLRLVLSRQHHRKQKKWKIYTARFFLIIATLIQFSAIGVIITTNFSLPVDGSGLEYKWPNSAYGIVKRVGVSLQELTVSFQWEVPLALILTSLQWWENFAEKDLKISKLSLPLKSIRETFHEVRIKSTIVAGIWKMGIVIGLAYLLVDDFQFQFSVALPKNNETILSVDNTSSSPNSTIISGNITQGGASLQQTVKFYAIAYAPAIAQVFSSLLCYYCSKLACKLIMQKFSFSIALTLATPAAFAVVYLQCKWQYVPGNFTWYCMEDSGDLLILHLSCFAVWWLSQMVIASHIWFPQAERLAKAEK